MPIDITDLPELRLPKEKDNPVFWCDRFEALQRHLWFSIVALRTREGRDLHVIPCYVFYPFRRRGIDWIAGAVHAALVKLHQGYMSTTRGLNP